MISIKIVLWLLFVHWVADFVCQSDWMAKNKSKYWSALLVHCGMYGIVVQIMTWNLFLGGIVCLIHIPIDYISSRFNAKLWNDGKIHWFFVSVGFDQFIHFVTLILAYYWIVR